MALPETEPTVPHPGLPHVCAKDPVNPKTEGVEPSSQEACVPQMPNPPAELGPPTGRTAVPSVRGPEGPYQGGCPITTSHSLSSSARGRRRTVLG